MNKICTSIEQSKKLIELGIGINTADMYWFNRHVDLIETKYQLFVVDNSNKYIDFFKSYAIAVDNNEIIPAWSLTALIDLMPNVNGHYPELCRGKLIGQYYMWIEDTFDTQMFNNPIDAALEMMVWLKENGKL